MRAWADWQDDVLQLVDHSSLCDLTKHTLEFTRKLTTPTADSTLPASESRAYFSFFFLELLSLLLCVLFVFYFFSLFGGLTRKDGGAGGPGVWEVRLCAPGWGDDGAVYGQSEAEVRAWSTVREEEGRGRGWKQPGVRDAKGRASHIADIWRKTACFFRFVVKTCWNK